MAGPAALGTRLAAKHLPWSVATGNSLRYTNLPADANPDDPLFPTRVGPALDLEPRDRRTVAAFGSGSANSRVIALVHVRNSMNDSEGFLRTIHGRDLAARPSQSGFDRPNPYLKKDRAGEEVP